ncbi:TIGR04283 family arsenosugar biosynthesis glycosyltransferase [Companilactobacillus allii]|uniref:Glycosyltransferase 2-like domain-containing protein n=1 Tax=Companilactobacillus allii TaxID=1847728 RepID=A0A1P8Q302_9LACO|nr:TIGR04283 family arsenosugar biosynthesis glycosyltransferase [Companilactobacillus allii]APX72179.1 hypothetical protein BTM29_06240 [Companilactobacillus allii]USQ69278.1 TIGR04283 family arsenosugar biosynthesis glycosyltransferase [Companilactobacillus allii]
MWLTIIIPIYHDDAALKHLIKRLSSWDLSGIDVLIIDGENRDRPDFLPKFVKYLNSVPNRGKQLHLGGSVARTNKLLFLHADSKFSTAPISLLKSTKVNVGFFTLRFDDNSTFFSILAFMSNLRAKKFKLIFGDQGFFVTKSLYSKVGGFPEQPLMEDWELSKRLSKVESEFVEFPISIYTSSRKYINEGKVRTFFKMQLIKILYKSGMKPSALSKVYYRRR